MSKYYPSYQEELESEAIFVLRKIWAHYKNPVIIISEVNYSIVVTNLAKKAL